MVYESSRQSRACRVQDIEQDPLSVHILGPPSTLFNSDLKLGLGGLPRLENLSIYPHHSFTRGDSRVAPTAFADLNPQLKDHAKGLKTLDVGWSFQSDSAAWAYLGSTRRLFCLPLLRNLVKLQISTQVLFGGLLPMLKRIVLDVQAADPETRDENLTRALARTLPASLRHLIVLERWSHLDVGHEDTIGSRINLDVTHEQGDWMEVRWRDGAGDDAASLEAEMINTPADFAILALMRALCRLWLRQRREERVVELQPWNRYYYGAYVHRVLMATKGLEKLRVRTETGPQGVGYAYCFVDTEFMRGVEVVVGRK